MRQYSVRLKFSLAVLIVMMWLQGCSESTPGKRARDFYDKAIIESEQKDFAAAIEDLQYALHLDPSFSQAYYALGTVYQKAGGLENAIQNFEYFLKFSPEHLDTHVRLARLHKISNHSKEAIREANYVLKRIPPTSQLALDMHLILARIYLYQKGEVDKSLFHFQKVTEKKPDMIEPYIAFSKYYFRRNRMAEGKKMLQKALKIDPRNLEALKMVRGLDFEEGNWEKIIQYYQDDIKKAERDKKLLLKIRILLANLYFRLKRYYEAETQADEILKLDRNDPDAKFIKAESAFMKKDYNTALSYYLFLRNSNFNIETVYFRLADIYRAKGLDNEVIGIYEKLIFIRPNIFEAHFLLIEHFFRKKEYHRALHSARDLLNRFIGFAEAYFYLGKGYFFLNMFEDAIDNFDNYFKELKKSYREREEFFKKTYTSLSVPEEYRNRDFKQNLVEANYLSVVSYLMMGKYEKTKRQIEKNPLQSSEIVDLFLYKAIVSQMFGDFQAGISACNVAISSLETNKSLCYFLKGTILISQGKLAEGKKNLKKGNKVLKGRDIDSLDIMQMYNAVGDSGLSHLNLAVMFLLNGKKDLAMREIDQALRANPENPIARFLKKNDSKLFLYNKERTFRALEQYELLRRNQNENR